MEGFGENRTRFFFLFKKIQTEKKVKPGKNLSEKVENKQTEGIWWCRHGPCRKSV